LNTIGVFKIRQSFNITNRGIVAFGHFIEGNARIGSLATIKVVDKLTPVKVTGIEKGNIDSDGNIPFGLLLSFEDKILEEIAKSERLKEQTIEILI
jgi:hypothetical protein